MFEFAYPWALLLIPVWAAVAFYVLFRKREPSLTVASAVPFRSARKRRIDLPKVLILLGALLLIAALARPRFGDEETVIRARGIDIVLALDLSGSMGALDVPESITDRAELERRLADGSLRDRLETAKAELQTEKAALEKQVAELNKRPAESSAQVVNDQHGTTTPKNEVDRYFETRSNARSLYDLVP